MKDSSVKIRYASRPRGYQAVVKRNKMTDLLILRERCCVSVASLDMCMCG